MTFIDFHRTQTQFKNELSHDLKYYSIQHFDLFKFCRNLLSTRWHTKDMKLLSSKTINCELNEQEALTFIKDKRSCWTQVEVDSSGRSKVDGTQEENVDTIYCSL